MNSVLISTIKRAGIEVNLCNIHINIRQAIRNNLHLARLFFALTDRQQKFDTVAGRLVYCKPIKIRCHRDR